MTWLRISSHKWIKFVCQSFLYYFYIYNRNTKLERAVLLYGVINVGEHANWRRCICCTPCSVKTYIYVLFKIVHFFSGWNIYVSDLRYSILCKNIAYSGKRESIINTKNLIRNPNTTLWFGFHQLLKSLILAIWLTVLKICFILQKWKINIVDIC